MTVGQFAGQPGLARAAFSTTLSKLANSGEVQKAERGYRRVPAAGATPAQSHARRVLLSERRRYGPEVFPIGFGFDVDAVLLDGIAHREECDRLPPVLSNEAISLPAAGVYRAGRCPRGCPKCGPRSKQC